MKKYTFSYRHQGKSWSLNYFADDWDDAQRKLQSLKNNATFDGELVASIEFPLIERIVRWLRK